MVTQRDGRAVRGHPLPPPLRMYVFRGEVAARGQGDHRGGGGRIPSVSEQGPLQCNNPPRCRSVPGREVKAAQSRPGRASRSQPCTVTPPFPSSRHARQVCRPRQATAPHCHTGTLLCPVRRPWQKNAPAPPPGCRRLPCSGRPSPLSRSPPAPGCRPRRARRRRTARRAAGSPQGRCVAGSVRPPGAGSRSGLRPSCEGKMKGGRYIQMGVNPKNGNLCQVQDHAAGRIQAAQREDEGGDVWKGVRCTKGGSK
jgi:hypothetical protein